MFGNAVIGPAMRSPPAPALPLSTPDNPTGPPAAGAASIRPHNHKVHQRTVASIVGCRELDQRSFEGGSFGGAEPAEQVVLHRPDGRPEPGEYAAPFGGE